MTRPVSAFFRLLLAAAALLPAAALGQGVGIGTTAPDASAALDVSSTTRGLLPPRLSQTQRDQLTTTQALGAAQAGLLIYNLDTKALNAWDGTRWQQVLGTGETGNPANPAPTPVTFGFTGGPQTYTVPAGVTQLQVVADGAGSGQRGQARRGARVTATLPVLPGEVLTVEVGGALGRLGANFSNGGYNGGKEGINVVFLPPSLTLRGYGGGGATDLRRASAAGPTGDYRASRNALLVAGGAGGSTANLGGAGGTPDGGDGAGPTTSGRGATQAGPGAASGGGIAGSGPNGGRGRGNSPNADDLFGGGGGGYYGGGGGGGVDGVGANGGGGGGGSSWVTGGATNVSYAPTPGAAGQNGQLTIVPETPLPAPAFSAANLVGTWQLGAGGLFYNTGNVGIGTASPAQKLDVAGNATVSGRMGIGTADPLRTLDVNGQLLLRQRLILAPQNGADPTSNGIWNLDNAGNDLRIFQEDNLSNAGGAVRLTVQNGGNVGIGTSTPGVPLDVQGTASTTLGGYAYLANIGPPTGFGGGATAGVSIRASGRVVAPEFNATSDRRLKTVVGLSDRAADLALLGRLRITDYTMKDRVQFGDRKFKKVIAQEVEEVFPQAVNK